MAQYMPSNEGLTYSDDGYFNYGEEDYEYLFEFTNYDVTYSDCEDLINRYNDNPNSVTALELKNLYYRLGYYYERMTPRKEICKIQLAYEIDYAEANNAVENLNENFFSGTSIGAPNAILKSNPHNKVKRKYLQRIIKFNRRKPANLAGFP